MKQKFNVITSSCIPLPLENVDTDQIIPARFLKAIDKEGMGDNLFRDWRYNADGTPKPDFVMNDPSYSGVPVKYWKRRCRLCCVLFGHSGRSTPQAANSGAGGRTHRAPRPGIGPLHGEETESGRRSGGNGSNGSR